MPQRSQLCSTLPAAPRSSSFQPSGPLNATKALRAGWRAAPVGCTPAGSVLHPAGWSSWLGRTRSRLSSSLQKLQLVLAPFHNLMPSAPEDVGADPISRLSHSLQQLDRIDSLSEQISFLEERLETCKCPEKAGLKYFTPPTVATVSRCRPARSVTHMPLLIYNSLKLSSL